MKLSPRDFWVITMSEFWAVYYGAFPKESKPEVDHDKMKAMIAKFDRIPSTRKKKK